ncbi:restriction endonuclease subunit S [Algibacter lectus]|uniref:Type I restriction-modification system specificity subunit S n=1 Tax=Algibacter lectus TaxID=221126 RepID=A0A090VG43_9FLAO|nr:restriction endonuclease subunit S [Algibacter lectus]GAL63760.1 type I restriction-modification system specificity subunit S [Algibacter lectus]
MEKYNKYKDSGIEWLGIIPEHWEVKRIKDCASKVKTGTTPSSKDGDYFSDGTENWFTPVDIKNNVINSSTRKVVKKSFIDNQISLFDQNSIYLIGIGGTLGNVAISTTKSSCNQQINVITFDDSICVPKFNFYQLIVVGNTLLSWCNYTTMPIFTQTATKQLELALPPIREQRQIANYLDTKTTAIDKKVNLLQQKIKHYKAYRKTLINETVTKGLDKTVKLKDSGIDWIGEIPEHWEVKRLKDVSKIFTGNSISDKSLFETNKDANNYIATKDINIHTKGVNYDNGVYIPKIDKSFKVTKKNTSLICLEGASAGKKLTFVDREVAFVNKLCAIKSFDKNVFDKYIFYSLQTDLFNSQFFELLSGLIGGVSLGLLKYFNILVPAIKEQQQIANYLDTKTTSIDKIVKNIETQIATLKELRKTLINEVVTGKVKVSA